MPRPAGATPRPSGFATSGGARPAPAPPGRLSRRRYWRVWRRLFALAVMRTMEYRTGFVLALLDSAGQLAVLLATYVVFYRLAGQGEVAGWSRADALVLVAVFWIFDGVWDFQPAPNLSHLAHLIHTGDLDFVLLRPVSTQFLVACWRGVQPAALAKVAGGLGLLVYAGQAAGVAWRPGEVLAALAFGACGLAVLYALRFAIVSCSFWVLQVSELYELFQGVFTTARFPVTYFQQPVRGLLTYVVPVAFATTFPAQALLGRADYRLLPAGLGLAAGALLATRLLWRRAVRHYSSASS